MPLHPGVLSHISYHDHFMQKRHVRFEHNDLITFTRVFGTEHLALPHIDIGGEFDIGKDVPSF
jgi:hypothetical protein